MDLITERERHEKRWEAGLHGIELKDDGTFSARRGTRSHSHLERMKAKHARRGH